MSDHPLAALAASHSITMADLAAWLEMQDARIVALEARLEATEDELVELQDQLIAVADPHGRRLARREAMAEQDPKWPQ